MGAATGVLFGVLFTSAPWLMPPFVGMSVGFLGVLLAAVLYGPLHQVRVQRRQERAETRLGA